MSTAAVTTNPVNQTTATANISATHPASGSENRSLQPRSS